MTKKRVYTKEQRQRWSKTYSQTHKAELKERNYNYFVANRVEIAEKRRLKRAANANPDKQTYYMRNKDKVDKARAEYRKAHPDALKAYDYANHNSTLTLAKCAVCGATVNLDRHYLDYRKPLEYTVMCKHHHKEKHPIPIGSKRNLASTSILFVP